jgi:ribose 5-phosphate isomerase B
MYYARRTRTKPDLKGTAMRVALGGDHAGFHLKQHFIGWLRNHGHEVIDLGAHSAEPSDYPDFAEAVGRAVLDGRADRGLVICGSGVGAAVAANKLPGIRAGLCHDTYSAGQGVAHDDINVLVLGARVIGQALAEAVVTTFLAATFSNGERHVRRLAKVKAIEDSVLASAAHTPQSR